jgi:hypothetical protein
MKPTRIQIAFLPILVLLMCSSASSPGATALAQAIAGTSTPTIPRTNAFITVLYDEPFANIRLGPGSIDYPKVGRLYPGDTATALGRSPGGDWIQIEIVSNPNDEFVPAPNNKGWVYAALVQLTGGPLQIVEPPPTPIPPPTATIDPTLAAQFTVYPTNTHLPTYTPPPPLVIPTFTRDPLPSRDDRISLAVIIMAIGGLGLVTFSVSLFVRRN